jgi:hypothetical protein
MERIAVQGQPGQIVHKTPSPKITRAERTGGVAHEVEHLLCKPEALSSNPRLIKKKKDFHQL